MNRQQTIAIALLCFALGGCQKKEAEDEQMIPPGFCKTEAECQPMADRQQAYQNKLHDELSARGVHDEYLPCGKYKPQKAPNGYWTVERDTSGCPSTASQQDPHPDLQKAKQSKGETPK